MKTISLVMIVKNEANVLQRCLKSVRPYVDEIIVVDTGSIDHSKEVALSFGAKVFDFTWTNSFADARNYALEHATCDWNLVLDADEYLVKDCGEALKEFINDNGRIGKITKKNKVMHQDGVAYENSYTSRLFPRGLRYKGRVHEQIDSELPRIKVEFEVEHDGYYNKTKSDRNIPLLKMEIEENPNDAYYIYQIAKEYQGIGDLKLANQYFKQAYSLLTKKEVYAPNVIVEFLFNIVAIGNSELKEGITILENEQLYLQDYPDFHFVSGAVYLNFILQDITRNAHLMPIIEESYLKCLQLGETEQYDSIIGRGSFKALYNLGIYYEVTGMIEKAKVCYQEAAKYNYQPAIDRL